MRCNPRRGGSPRPAGSVPRGGRRPDRDSSTHTTTEQEKHQMPFPSPTNSATLIGKLTRDPELRTVTTSAGDRSVLTLGIAVRKPIKTDQDHTPTADFFDVTVWGELAETCSRHLYKGRLVAISARLQPTMWEAKDGSKRRGLELVANTVNFLDSPRNRDSSEQQPAE